MLRVPCQRSARVLTLVALLINACLQASRCSWCARIRNHSSWLVQLLSSRACPRRACRCRLIRPVPCQQQQHRNQGVSGPPPPLAASPQAPPAAAVAAGSARRHPQPPAHGSSLRSSQLRPHLQAPRPPPPQLSGASHRGRRCSAQPSCAHLRWSRRQGSTGQSRAARHSSQRRPSSTQSRTCACRWLRPERCAGQQQAAVHSGCCWRRADMACFRAIERPHAFVNAHTPV